MDGVRENSSVGQTILEVIGAILSGPVSCAGDGDNEDKNVVDPLPVPPDADRRIEYEDVGADADAGGRPVVDDCYSGQNVRINVSSVSSDHISSCSVMLLVPLSLEYSPNAFSGLFQWDSTPLGDAVDEDILGYTQRAEGESLFEGAGLLWYVEARLDPSDGCSVSMDVYPTVFDAVSRNYPKPGEEGAIEGGPLVPVYALSEEAAECRAEGDYGNETLVKLSEPVHVDFAGDGHVVAVCGSGAPISSCGDAASGWDNELERFVARAVPSSISFEFILEPVGVPSSGDESRDAGTSNDTGMDAGGEF